jgi:amidase
MAMAPSFDVPGWFASGPGVLGKVGTVLLDRDRVEARIERLLIAEDGFAQADAAVAPALRAALDRMTVVLPKAEAVTVAPDGFDPWREAFRIIQARETWATFGDFITRHRPNLGPGIKERLAFAATVSEADTQAPRAAHETARARMHALLPPGTVLALPTAPSIAPLLDASGEDVESYRIRVMRLTCMAGLGGLPQVSIPAAAVAGCPVGLSFIGWSGGDEVLLDLTARVGRFCGVAG